MSTTPRKPRKLRKGPGRASVDESADFSPGQDSTAPTMDSSPPKTSETWDTRQVFERSDSQLTGLPDSVRSGSTASFVQRQDDIPEDENDGEGEGEGEDVTQDERAMRRHFMDVESSFLPEAGVPQEEGKLGVGIDDTYLELGKPGRTPPPDQMFAGLSEGRRAMFAPPGEEVSEHSEQD